MIELSTHAIYGDAVIDMQKHVYAKLNELELQQVKDLLTIKGNTAEQNVRRLDIAAKLETCRESKVQLLENKVVCESAFTVFQDNLSDSAVVRGESVNAAVLNRKLFDKAADAATLNVVRAVTQIREDRLVARYSAH